MNDGRRAESSAGFRRGARLPLCISVTTTNCKPIKAPAAEPTMT
jgi:hypothetical protein